MSASIHFLCQSGLRKYNSALRSLKNKDNKRVEKTRKEDKQLEKIAKEDKGQEIERREKKKVRNLSMRRRAVKGV